MKIIEYQSAHFLALPLRVRVRVFKYYKHKPDKECWFHFNDYVLFVIISLNVSFPLNKTSTHRAPVVSNRVALHSSRV